MWHHFKLHYLKNHIKLVVVSPWTQRTIDYCRIYSSVENWQELTTIDKQKMKQLYRGGSIVINIEFLDINMYIYIYSYKEFGVHLLLAPCFSILVHYDTYVSNIVSHISPSCYQYPNISHISPLYYPYPHMSIKHPICHL